MSGARPSEASETEAEAPEGASDEGEGAREGAAPSDLSRLERILEERDRALEKRFKKLNDELRDRRHAVREDRASASVEDRKPEERPRGDEPDVVTRAELRAQRDFDREIAALEATGLDASKVRELEDAADEMLPATRAEWIRGIRRGFELAAQNAPTGDRDGRRRETTPRSTRGGEPPARARGGPSLPDSWDEYLEIARTDKKRKAEIDAEVAAGRFDLVELRNRGRASQAARVLGSSRRR